jgi:hypothetical protein
MQKKRFFYIGSAVLIILIISGLWLLYFSDRPKLPPEPEQFEKTHEIEIPAPLDGVEDEEVNDLMLDEKDEAEPGKEDGAEKDLADEILRDGFINRLAEMIYENYFPAQSPGEPSRFMLSFKMVNMHFATDLSDFEVEEEDILEARQEVMQHFLQPVVISTAVNFYGPKLMDRIVYLAENVKKTIPKDQGSEERLLRKAETADLLRLFSRRISYLARVFERSVTGEDVLDLVNDYLRTVDELRDVYFEYWQLDNDSENQEKERLGRNIHSLIEQREAIREKILIRVATTDMRQAGHDYVYESQWVYRRVRVDGFSKNSIQSMADAGKALSLMALDRAESVLENN